MYVLSQLGTQNTHFAALLLHDIQAAAHGCVCRKLKQQPTVSVCAERFSKNLDDSIDCAAFETALENVKVRVARVTLRGSF